MKTKKKKKKIRVQCSFDIVVQKAVPFLWKTETEISRPSEHIRVSFVAVSTASSFCLHWQDKECVFTHLQVHVSHLFNFLCFCVYSCSSLLKVVLICVFCQSLNHVFWHKSLEVVQWCVKENSTTGEVQTREICIRTDEILFWPVIMISEHSLLRWFSWFGWLFIINWTVSECLMLFVHFISIFNHLLITQISGVRFHLIINEAVQNGHCSKHLSLLVAFL